ncbi:MAG: LptF/LptG family permease, partial [Cyanobacteria bacterium HKST-UBA06]|nr:LptF/LptG family permease [Cyanobacteria bacterium HKST-UBA06]
MIRRVNTILDRYLAQRMGLISLFALVLFTVAWLAPEILFRAVRGIADKELTVAQGLLYLALQVPGVLAYCIPIAALFSSVFLFRQLSLSSELVAIQAAGISFKRLLLPIGLVGLALTSLFVLNQEVLQPQALKGLKHLSNTTGFQKQEQVPPFVTFVERSDNGQMSKFLIILPEAAPEQSQFICLFFNTVSKEMKTQIEGLENASQYITRIVTAQSSQWDASNSV